MVVAVKTDAATRSASGRPLTAITTPAGEEIAGGKTRIDRSGR
jgi:hypothetical protein